MGYGKFLHAALLLGTAGLAAASYSGHGMWGGGNPPNHYGMMLQRTGKQKWVKKSKKK